MWRKSCVNCGNWEHPSIMGDLDAHPFWVSKFKIRIETLAPLESPECELSNVAKFFFYFLFWHPKWGSTYKSPIIEGCSQFPRLMRPLHVQAICANRVFAQIAWQCRVLFACLRKLLAWNQNSLIFFAQAANACAVWVLVCTNKPQYYSELTPCGCASCRYL